MKHVVLSFIQILAFARISRVMGQFSYPYMLLTVLSNTVSLLSFSQVQVGLYDLCVPAGALGSFMATSYWTLKVIFGNNAIYEKKSRIDAFNTFVDHFLIPMCSVFVCFIEDVSVRVQQDVFTVSLFVSTWLFYTIHSNLTYPF